jgi:hypothetical protein
MLIAPHPPPQQKEGFLFGSTMRHVVDNVEDAEIGVQEGKTRLGA